MENNSDSDKSYDIVSWDEFCKSATDSDQEENSNREMDGSDSSKSPERENEHTDKVYFSGNSSYDDDSSDSESDNDPSDPPENSEAEVAVLRKRKRPLEVPTEFEKPRYIKRREEVEIQDLVKDHVLLFLPAKSLARFKAVSKEWNQWISSPFFDHKQAYFFRDLSGFFCQAGEYVTPTYVSIGEDAYGICTHSLSFLPEKVNIRSSCYGLLLCQGISDDNAYYVCNPVNSEYMIIPQPDLYHGQDPAVVLAFEPSELNIPANFTIICAVPLMDDPIVYFEIYSSETKLWRMSPVACIEVEDLNISGGGFYVNKIAYFMTDSGKVLVFDPSGEFCGVLSLPGDCPWNGTLTRMEGELRYIHACHVEGATYGVRVYGGMDMILKKNIKVCLDDMGIELDSTVCRVLPFVTDKGDDVAILVGEMVWLYRMREERGEIISHAGNLSAKYFPFVSSLVHLPVTTRFGDLLEA